MADARQLQARSLRAAAIQMVSGKELEENLAQAAKLLQEAAEKGAQLAVLPENFAVFSTQQMIATGQAEAQAHRIEGFLQAEAKRWGLWIVGGSVPTAQLADGRVLGERVRSCCWVMDDQGATRARYDKIHLFDVNVADAHGRYQESATFAPGDTVVVVDTAWGRLGLAICYDLRFPELFRQMRDRGADFFSLPAAFTRVTGEAHWHCLLRARAIENQCFVIAAGQGGIHTATRETYGHSLLIDPWGEVLAEFQQGPGVVLADLDLDRLAEVRERMPVQAHRRL